MSEISGAKFFSIEDGKVTYSIEKKSLSAVVKKVLNILEEQTHELTYIDVQKIYSTYKNALQKRSLGNLLVWWNGDKLDLLRTKRDELFRKLIQNPSSKDLKQLIEASPDVILSGDAKKELQKFVEQLPETARGAYINKFVQGNLQEVLADISRRSDFIDKFPEIIERGISAINVDAIQGPSFAKTMADALSQRGSLEGIEKFFKEHAKEISRVRKSDTGLENTLLRMLDAKYSLILKRVEQVQGKELPFFRTLRIGGSFSIGEYHYRVSEKGIQPEDLSNIHQRLVLVEALVKSGDWDHLKAVFTPSLILQSGKCDQQCVDILKGLVTAQDPAVALRAAYILKKAGETVDVDSLTKAIQDFDKGSFTLDNYELYALTQIKGLENPKIQEQLLASRESYVGKKEAKQKPSKEIDKVEEALHNDLQTYKNAFDDAKCAKSQPVLSEFVRIANQVKKGPTESIPLTDDFTPLLKDLKRVNAEVNKIQKRYEELASIQEKKVYALLPPWQSPSINDLILQYAQESVNPKDALSQAISELIFVKQVLQKCERVKSKVSDPVALEKELKSVPSYKNRLEYPYLQVFEYFLNVYARPEQIASIEKLGPADREKILQLLMGSGKTFLLLPVLALLRANGVDLSAVMVPDALVLEVFKQLQGVLGVSFQRHVALFEIPKGEPSVEDLQELLHKLQDIKQNKGVLVLTPERKHAFLNMVTSILDKGKDQEALVALKIMGLLSSSENVIADEIDQLLKTNLQYIISIGEAKTFEEPQARIISELTLTGIEKGFQNVVPHALKLLAQEESWSDLVEENEQAITTFLSVKTKKKGDEDALMAEKFFNALTAEQKRLLLDLRTTIVDVLPEALSSICNEEYGVTDFQESFIATPFDGAGSPAKTRFSDPCKQIVLTILAMEKNGIPVKAFEKAGINMNATPKEIWRDKKMKRSFLHQYVLPQVEIHAERYSSGGQKLVSSSKVFSGTSGTFWNVRHFAHFDEIMPDEQEEVRALLSVEKKVTINPIGSKSKEEELLSRITPNHFALIDTGGWLREISIAGFALKILSLRNDLDFVVVHNVNGELVAINREGKEVSDIKSIPPEKRFTIYRQQYTTGVDIAQVPSAQALMTVGKKMILRDYQQGLYRMRDIEKGQSADILYDQEAQTEINKLITWETEKLGYEDFLKFLIVAQDNRIRSDSYPSDHQRMKDRIEAKIREKLCEFASLDDITAINELFKSARSIMVVQDSRGVPEDWVFPEEVARGSQKILDVKSYLEMIKPVASKISLDLSELEKELFACCETGHDDELVPSQLSEVGNQILVMKEESKKSVQQDLRFQEVEKSVQNLHQKVREEIGSISRKSITDKFNIFEENIKSLDALNWNSKVGLINTLGRELLTLASAHKRLEAVKNELPNLNLITKILGSNSVIESFQMNARALEIALNKGVLENQLDSFNGAYQRLTDELDQLEKRAPIRDEKGLEEFHNVRVAEKEKVKTQLTELSKNTQFQFIKHRALDVLDIQDDSQRAVECESLLREFARAQELLDTLTPFFKGNSFVKLKSQLSAHGFAAFEKQLKVEQEGIRKQQDVKILESMVLHTKGLEALGLREDVESRLAYLKMRTGLLGRVKAITTSTENLQKRKAACNVKLTDNKTTPSALSFIEQEVADIEQAEQWYKDLPKLEPFSSSQAYTSCVRNFWGRVNASDLSKEKRVQFEQEHMLLSKMPIGDLLKEMSHAQSSLKKYEEIGSTSQISELKRLLEKDAGARIELKKQVDAIQTYTSQTPSELYGFVQKNLQALKLKVEAFTNARGALEKYVDKKSVEERKLLESFKEKPSKNNVLKLSGIEFINRSVQYREANTQNQFKELQDRVQNAQDRVLTAAFEKLGSAPSKDALVQFQKYLEDRLDVLSQARELEIQLEGASNSVGQKGYAEKLQLQLSELENQKDIEKLKKQFSQVKNAALELLQDVSFQSTLKTLLLTVQEGVTDNHTIDSLAQVIEESKGRKILGQYQKEVTDAIGTIASQGNLEGAKRIVDSTNWGRKEAVNAYLNYSQKKLDKEIDGIAQQFLQSEKRDHNQLMSIFAQKYSEQAQKIVAEFKSHQFLEKDLNLVVQEFQKMGVRASLHLNAQVYGTLAREVTEKISHLKKEELLHAVEWIDVATEQMKGYEDIQEISDSLKMLSTAKKQAEIQLNEILSTEQKTGKIAKKVFYSMALGGAALTATTMGFAPFVTLWLTKAAFKQVTSIGTDVVVDKVTEQLPKSCQTVGSLLMKFGVGFGVDSMISAYSQMMVQSLYDLTSVTNKVEESLSFINQEDFAKTAFESQFMKNLEKWKTTPSGSSGVFSEDIELNSWVAAMQDLLQKKQEQQTTEKMIEDTAMFDVSSEIPSNFGEHQQMLGSAVMNEFLKVGALMSSFFVSKIAQQVMRQRM